MPRCHIGLVLAVWSLQNFVTDFRDLGHGAQILATIPGRPGHLNVTYACVLQYLYKDNILYVYTYVYVDAVLYYCS